MKILLINQYFWPDMAATSQLLGDLAEDLEREGGGRFQVTALAGRGTYAPGREGPLPGRESWRGIRIRRVPSTNFGRRNKLGRVLDYATFLSTAALAVLFGPRADAVVALSTPPLVAVLGLLARLRGSRFIYKVEDLYPDVAVALGVFREGSLTSRFFARLSALLLARADAVVALDGAMARSLAARGARRIEVIPNWADGRALLTDKEAGAAFRREVGLPAEALVVLYSGNLGLAHRFDTVTEIARRLAHDDGGGPGREVLFLFVGAGPRLEEVQAATAGLPNVRFLPYQPRERLGALYSAADLHLITLRDAVAGLLVPSKYSASLGAEKPVLLIGGKSTDIYEEISHQGLGWAVPHQPEVLMAALTSARTDRDRLKEMGRRGRTLFQRKYDRPAATHAWQRLLEDILGENTRREPG